MPVRSSRVRVVALVLALPCLLTATAAAQKPGDKDLQAISAYTFTLPKYKQLMTAMINLGKAAQQNPSMADALEDSGNLSLDQMVARYSAVPAAKKAIVDAGLTPREYAVAQMAMIQAGMSYGIMKQYKLSPDSVSKTTGVSKANLEFFRANEAEIERMGKEMQAQMPKEKPADEADTAEEPDSAEPDSVE
jgi:hypothetical protein